MRYMYQYIDIMRKKISRQLTANSKQLTAKDVCSDPSYFASSLVAIVGFQSYLTSTYKEHIRKFVTSQPLLFLYFQLELMILVFKKICQACIDDVRTFAGARQTPPPGQTQMTTLRKEIKFKAAEYNIAAIWQRKSVA